MPLRQSTESAPDEMMVGSALAPHSSATAKNNIMILFIVFCANQMYQTTSAFCFASACCAPIMLQVALLHCRKALCKDHVNCVLLLRNHQCGLEMRGGEEVAARKELNGCLVMFDMFFETQRGCYAATQSNLQFPVHCIQLHRICDFLVLKKQFFSVRSA